MNCEGPLRGAAEKDFLGDSSHTMAKSPMISRDRSDITKSISCSSTRVVFSASSQTPAPEL